MKRIIGLILILMLGLAVQPALAWTEQEQSDIARIEAYLNQLKVAKADFVQIAADGTTSDGAFYLSRPGKLRFEYVQPNPVQIIATDGLLIYYDKKLEQVTYLGLDQTPAAFLLRDTISLSKGLQVTKLERNPGTLRVTVKQQGADQPWGSVIMTFSDKPLTLQHWTVIDLQGQKTQVALNNLQSVDSLSPKLFDFDDPNQKKRSKTQ